MRRLAVPLVTVLALLVGACGGDDDSASDDEISATSTTTAAPADAEPVACKANSGDADSLEGVLPDTVAAGFEVQPDEDFDTGPSDLAKAVRDDGEPDAEEVLRSSRFRAGYQRIWLDADEAQIIAFVYEFCDAVGAQAYAERFTSTGSDEGYSTFPVPDVPDARGWYGADDGVATARAELVHGPYLLLAVSNADEGTTDEATLRTRSVDLVKALVAGVDAPG